VAALDLLGSGNAADAVAQLEQGTAFLLQERLERRLFHLEDLRLIGAGDLLDAYLSKADHMQGLGSMIVSGVGPVLAELRELVGHIRGVAGYERFLAPPEFARLVRLGYPDPVVYVVAGDDTGWAVLVRPGAAPLPVPLPHLTRAATQQQVASSWFNSLREPVWAARVAELDAVAAWCWDSCIGPICAEVEEGSRLTVVPAGPVALLPLQVAFAPDARALHGRRYAIDHLVLSFAPNMRIASFSRRPPGLADTVPVSALAPTPGDGTSDDRFALPSSGPEARYVAKLYGQAARAGGDATVDELLAGLRRPGVVHFAGHARTSPSVSEAHFLRFAGDRLMPLHELAAVGDAAAELVVLSACTSTLGTFTHPEQAITFASTLLVAGARGVVATMWRVIDDATAILACRFHDLARATPSAVPEALRAAQQWFRGATRSELQDAAAAIGITLESEPEWLETPLAWGAFVHCGSAGSRGLLEPRSLPRPGPLAYHAEDIANYYSFPAGREGSATSIGVVDLIGDYAEADLDGYAEGRGRPRVEVERVDLRSPGAASAAATSGDAAALTAFLQVVSSVAPGASVAVYLAENHEQGLVEALSRSIVHGQHAVVCLTTPVSEGDVSPAVATVLGRLANAAAAAGGVLCVAAGMPPADGPGTNGSAVLLAGHSYVLSCAATRAAPAGEDGLEHPADHAFLPDNAYERPDWQTEAVVEPATSLPKGSLVPDVSALGGPYRCFVDGGWTWLEGEPLALALWAGLLVRVSGAVNGAWGGVPDLYKVFAPAGALVAVPRSDPPAAHGWRRGIGLGTPDGAAFLAARLAAVHADRAGE
jgi:CHAT domain-containing protein